MDEKITLNDYLWKEGEEILFKQIVAENKYKPPQSYILIRMLMFGLMGISILAFGIVALFIFLFIFLIYIILFFKKRKLLQKKFNVSKTYLKNYQWWFVITNKRVIMKHYDLFEKNPEEIAINILYKNKEIILVDINAINIAFFNYSSVKDKKVIYELRLASFFDRNSYFFSYQFSSEELITVMKILYNLIEFKQEEHDIYGKVWYFRNRQELPQELKQIFKSEKNNLNPLKDIIKIDN